MRYNDNFSLALKDIHKAHTTGSVAEKVSPVLKKVFIVCLIVTGVSLPISIAAGFAWQAVVVAAVVFLAGIIAVNIYSETILPRVQDNRELKARVEVARLLKDIQSERKYPSTQGGRDW